MNFWLSSFSFDIAVEKFWYSKLMNLWRLSVFSGDHTKCCRSENGLAEVSENDLMIHCLTGFVGIGYYSFSLKSSLVLYGLPFIKHDDESSKYFHFSSGNIWFLLPKYSDHVSSSTFCITAYVHKQNHDQMTIYKIPHYRVVRVRLYM